MSLQVTYITFLLDKEQPLSPLWTMSFYPVFNLFPSIYSPFPPHFWASILTDSETSFDPLNWSNPCVSLSLLQLQKLINSDPHEGFPVICLFCLVSQVPSLPLFSLEKSLILQVGLGFFFGFLSAFWLLSLLLVFFFNNSKKTYLFALYQTTESLITVSCWSPVRSFHLLDYWRYFVSPAS